jgi:glucose/arabinose dehydrogenase
MDTLSHGLWGGLVFGRRHFFWALFLGAAPDLFSFGPFFFRWAWMGFPAFPQAPGLRAPALDAIPHFVFTAYRLTHSLVMWTAVFLILWAIFRRPVWVFGAWALHILCDIPTHSTRYFPTPFLWPFSTPYVNGTPWSRPWFMITNYGLLIFGFAFLALRKRKSQISLFFAALSVCFLVKDVNAGELALNKITLPPGFHIEVFAPDVPGARSMTLSPSGILFVGTRDEGKVYAILDSNHDQKADRVVVLKSGLDLPNGVAFRNGSLYVAEVSRILRFDEIEKHLENPLPPVVVKGDLPTAHHHGWKFIAFGPDGKLYVPIGAPCNICESEDPRFASITRMDPDGSHFEIFAKGIRNTVGFDWRPLTRELWFTDNGRDMLGDDLPPDELNRAPSLGLHFGYPYCHGKNISDPEFGKKHACSEFTPPVQELGPHVASLGMRFYTGKMFPEEYRGNIFIAEHGSWNRSQKIGYRITRVVLSGNQAVRYQTFAEGWLQGDQVWGRPVDVLVMPDGALLVSDDLAGAIYRIRYSPPQR